MADKLNTTRVKLYILLGCIVWYLFDKGAWLFHQMNPEVGTSERLIGVFSYYSRAFKNPLPSFAIADMKVGLIGVGIAVAMYLMKNSDTKKYRKGEEYGSARWGRSRDIEPYIDHEDEDNNILLTATESLKLNGRMSKPEYERNKNVLIVGGSGSGKTRFFVKPQLMQMHSSYVITDPKGSAARSVMKSYGTAVA